MYWLNLWLNPLRVSPLVGGRWVFQLKDAHHARGTNSSESGAANSRVGMGWLEWMGWLPKTVAHANPSWIQRVGETSASAEGTEDNCYVSLLAFWHSVGAETCLALGSSGPWKGHLWSWHSRRRQWNWPMFCANPKREKEGMMRCSATSQQMMSPISTAPPPHPPPRCRFFLLFLLAFLFLFFLLALPLLC